MAKGKAVAVVEETPASKGPSLVIQVGLLLGMTVAALGVGWLSGSYLKSSQAQASAKPVIAKHEAKPEDKPDDKPKDEKSHDPEAGPKLVELPTITTNLASPTTVWIRLDASIVLDAPQPPELVDAVHQDLLALVRTLKMHQVEGPSGYQHLKADLQERAAIRSGGHVKDVLIRTLLFE